MKKLILVVLLAVALLASGCIQVKDEVKQTFFENGSSYVSANIGLSLSKEALSMMSGVSSGGSTDRSRKQVEIIAYALNNATYEALCKLAPKDVACTPKEGYAKIAFTTSNGFSTSQQADWIKGKKTMTINVSYVPSPLTHIDEKALKEEEKKLVLAKYTPTDFISLTSGYSSEEPCTNIQLADDVLSCQPLPPPGKEYVEYACGNESIYIWDNNMSYDKRDGESFGYWNSTEEASAALEEELTTTIALKPFKNDIITCPSDTDYIFLIGREVKTALSKPRVIPGSYYIKVIEVDNTLNTLFSEMNETEGSELGSTGDLLGSNEESSSSLTNTKTLIDFENGTILGTDAQKFISSISTLSQYGGYMSLMYTIELPKGYEVKDLAYGSMPIMYRQQGQDVIINLKGLFSEGSSDMPLEIEAEKEMFPPYTLVVLGLIVLGIIAYFAFFKGGKPEGNRVNGILEQ